MTLYYLEVQVVQCDGCDNSEENKINTDHENAVESEHMFLEDLKNEGWIYCEKTDQHFCPDCIKEMSEEELSDLIE